MLGLERFSQREHMPRKERTSINMPPLAILTRKLDINKIDLQLFVCLDTDQERRATAGSDDFIWVVFRLENKSKGSLQLLQNSLDEIGEGQLPVLVGVVNVLGEDRNGFGVGFSLECVSALLKDSAKLGAVGYNAIVDNAEVRIGIRTDGVAVDLARGTVGGPSRVCDGDLADGRFFDVERRLCDLLAETSDLANLLEVDDRPWLIAVNAEACRVVASIFLAGKPSTKDFENLLASLKRKVRVRRQPRG